MRVESGRMVKQKDKPKNRIGRPSALTEVMIDKICELLDLGLSRGKACIYVDYTLDKLGASMEKNDELSHRIKKAEVACELHHLDVIRNRYNGWQASAWMLERKYWKEYAASRRNEASEDASSALKLIIANARSGKAAVN